MKNRLKKELLTKNKNIFKALHDLYDFDFNADFSIVKRGGSFTANSIKRALDVSDFNDTNAVVVMADVMHAEQYLYIVRCCNSGFEICFPRYISYIFRIDDFYTKKRFEDIRKENNKIYYIISQRKELKKPASKKVVDMSERFKYVRHTNWGDGRGNHGISQMDLICLTNQKKINIHMKNPGASTDINYFIDKSGYFLETKKIELKRKAKDLKAQREKSVVDSITFDNEIMQFASEITNIKTQMIEKLKTANNYDEICSLETNLMYLRWVYFYLEAFKERNNNKTFASVQAAKKSLENIKSRIEKIEL